jgi:hypothetical protein
MSPLSSAPLKAQYRWKSFAEIDGAPYFAGNGFVLEPVVTINTEEVEDVFIDEVDGGFSDFGMQGHAAHQVEGATTWIFDILDPVAEKRLGALVADSKGGQIVAIHDLDLKDQLVELGSKIVLTVTANSEDPISVIKISESSRSFWEGLGADFIDVYDNSRICWSSITRRLSRKASAGVF